MSDAQLYESDDFRIFCYKVLPCSKRFCHDWTTCPFAHPAEKATRRDVRVCNYTGVACPEMKKNLRCPRGESCTFAHNVFEYWLHPSRYRTQLCNDGLNCKRKTCFFAHSMDQLRASGAKAGRAEDQSYDLNPFPLKGGKGNPVYQYQRVSQERPASPHDASSVTFPAQEAQMQLQSQLARGGFTTPAHSPHPMPKVPDHAAQIAALSLLLLEQQQQLQLQQWQQTDPIMQLAQALQDIQGTQHMFPQQLSPHDLLVQQLNIMQVQDGQQQPTNGADPNHLQKQQLQQFSLHSSLAQHSLRSSLDQHSLRSSLNQRSSVGSAQKAGHTLAPIGRRSDTCERGMTNSPFDRSRLSLESSVSYGIPSLSFAHVGRGGDATSDDGLAFPRNLISNPFCL